MFLKAILLVPTEYIVQFIFAYRISPSPLMTLIKSQCNAMFADSKSAWELPRVRFGLFRFHNVTNSVEASGGRDLANCQQCNYLSTKDSCNFTTPTFSLLHSGSISLKTKETCQPWHIANNFIVTALLWRNFQAFNWRNEAIWPALLLN